MIVAQSGAGFMAKVRSVGKVAKPSRDLRVGNLCF